MLAPVDTTVVDVRLVLLPRLRKPRAGSGVMILHSGENNRRTIPAKLTYPLDQHRVWKTPLELNWTDGHRGYSISL